MPGPPVSTTGASTRAVSSQHATRVWLRHPTSTNLGRVQQCGTPDGTLSCRRVPAPRAKKNIPELGQAEVSASLGFSQQPSQAAAPWCYCKYEAVLEGMQGSWTGLHEENFPPAASRLSLLPSACQAGSEAFFAALSQPSKVVSRSNRAQAVRLMRM